MNNKVKFNRYAEMLREWSGRMNLVAPSTLSDIETRHFADSAQLADVLPTDVNIIDLGLYVTVYIARLSTLMDFA